MAFVLAVGAAMLVRELIRLRNTHPGLETANVLTMHLGHRMTPRTDVRQFYEIARRARELPGVRAAGFIHNRASHGVTLNAMPSDSSMPMLALIGIGLM